jgi:hypothetical protein
MLKLDSLSYVFIVGSNVGQVMACISLSIAWLPTPFACFPIAAIFLHIDMSSRSEWALPSNPKMFIIHIPELHWALLMIRSVIYFVCNSFHELCLPTRTFNFILISLLVGRLRMELNWLEMGGSNNPLWTWHWVLILYIRRITISS